MAPLDLISITCTSCANVLCISPNGFVRYTDQHISPLAKELFSNCGIVEADGVGRGSVVKVQACAKCGQDVGLLCGRTGTMEVGDEEEMGCRYVTRSFFLRWRPWTHFSVKLDGRV